jgi:hypothetical protein
MSLLFNMQILTNKEVINVVDYMIKMDLIIIHMARKVSLLSKLDKINQFFIINYLIFTIFMIFIYFQIYYDNMVIIYLKTYVLHDVNHSPVRFVL